jgi:hypothetical protein
MITSSKQLNIRIFGTCYNLNTWEVEAGGLQVQGQPGLYSEFATSLDYIESQFLSLSLCI